MLGLDARVARYTWTVAFVLLLLGALYLIQETLFVFVVALLFAYLLWPLVDHLNRHLPGRSRGPALAIVYLMLIGVLIAIGISIGSRVVLQANALATRVPELISKTAQPEESTVSPQARSLRATVISTLRTQIFSHSRELLSLLPKVALSALSHAGSLLFVVLVPILSFFFLKDGHEIRGSIMGLFGDGAQRDLVQELARDLNVLLARYMRALVLLATSALVGYGVFLSAIGVPYAVLLAAIAFPLEFIPVVGPLAAAVIILMVAGLSGFHHLLWIVIFIAVFRLFQDYVLSPHIMSSGMELHPLAVIFGVLAGGQIAGIPGSFLSVPVLAALRIVFRALRRAHA